MTRPITIAVVGHTNAGKTSLLRTLTRRRDFGAVSEQPGTTRHVEAIELRIDGRSALRFLDTPGLEDSVALWSFLQAQPGDDRPERVRAFLRGPEARASFEQEAKVLRQLQGEADAAFYVIDSREPVLPKHRAEIEILNSCAKPLMPVLNFVQQGRIDEWQQALAAAGLHAQTRFDAVAPFVGAEQQLYQDLATLLPAHRAQLLEIVPWLQQERGQRRSACARAIAELLVRLAALRREVGEGADAKRAEQDFQQLALKQVRATADALLEIHGFRTDDLQLVQLPWQDGRWDRDLFHPEALRDAGRRLGLGAAIGASLGVVLDLAVGGLSLGAGAALGGAIGSIASQGWRGFAGKLANQFSGVQELSLGDAFLFLVALQLASLTRALDKRGHAALEALVQEAVPAGQKSAGEAEIRRAIHAVAPARARPEWEHPGSASSSGRRAEVRDEAARQMDQALSA